MPRAVHRPWLPSGREACALALAWILIVGNGAAIQAAAWAGMVAARWSSEGLDRAVRGSLSGERPCDLCVVARDLHSRDQGMPGPDGRERGPAAPVKALAVVDAAPVPAGGSSIPRPPAPVPGEPHRHTCPAPEPPPPRDGVRPLSPPS
jgi:hypothetical protein